MLFGKSRRFTLNMKCHFLFNNLWNLISVVLRYDIQGRYVSDKMRSTQPEVELYSVSKAKKSVFVLYVIFQFDTPYTNTKKKTDKKINTISTQKLSLRLGR